MKIDWEVTVDETLEYIQHNKKRKNLNDKEVLFMEYALKKGMQAEELFYMIIQKGNLLLLPSEELKGLMDFYYDKFGKTVSFQDYLEEEKTLSITGITNIMVPSLAYCGVELETRKSFCKLLNEIVDRMPEVAKKIDSDWNIEYSNALFSHIVTNKIQEVPKLDTYLRINIDKQKSLKMLKVYQNVYGIESVTKVKQITKELSFE